MKVKMFRKNQKINPYLWIGALITGILALFVLVSFFYMPYDPTAMNIMEKHQGISLRHWMGTDKFGRDIFCRVLYGSRITFLIAILTVTIGAGVGTLIGAFCGYLGGWLDETLMRLMDALFAFPSLLLALVFVSLFGTGTFQVAFALGIAFIPSFSRIVRSEFKKIAKEDYIAFARLERVPTLRILFVHMLPNASATLMSSLMIGFNNAVLAEAGLSFLGIGAQPPKASLGQMLSDAQPYLLSIPLYVIAPGVVLILMVLGFSFLGEGISASTREGMWSK